MKASAGLLRQGMVQTLLLFLLAFAIGVALSTQTLVNSRLAVGIGGNGVGAGLVSVLGSTLVLMAIAALRGDLWPAVATLPGQPVWRLSGGVLGAGIIAGLILLAPRIGFANLLALVIAGQLLFSLSIDHFGLLGAALRPVTAVKLAGAMVIVAGVLLTLFGDRLLDRS